MFAGVDLGVMALRLWYAEQRLDLGEYRAERPALAQRAEVFLRTRLAERATGFGPYPFRDQVRQLAAGGHVAHQRHRGGMDAETARRESRHEARHAQHPQRILHEGIRYMVQQAIAHILSAAVGVDQAAIPVLGHRVDAEVASRQVVLERDLRAGLAGEARVAVPALAFATRERVFLAGFGMQEHGEIATDLAKAEREHLLAAGANDDPVPFAWRYAEHAVAHRAADQIDLHRACRGPKKAVYPIRRGCRSGFSRTIVRMNADLRGHMSARMRTYGGTCPHECGPTENVQQSQ